MKRTSISFEPGFESPTQPVGEQPRFFSDPTHKGRNDIVGFGETVVWTALSNGDGTFQTAQFVIANFGYEAGDWRVKNIRASSPI
jgi:hypothetical protein